MGEIIIKITMITEEEITKKAAKITGMGKIIETKDTIINRTPIQGMDMIIDMLIIIKHVPFLETLKLSKNS